MSESIVINGVTYPARQQIAFPGSSGQPVVYELPTEAEPVLNGTSTRPPQTKAVYNAVQTLQQLLASPFVLKGSVATVAALANISNPDQNDCYYVEAENCLYGWTGSSTPGWVQVTYNGSDYAQDVAALKGNISVDRNITNWFVSANSNYLNDEDLNMTGNYFNPVTGAISSATGYVCGYIRIPCPGTYQFFSPKTTFGSNHIKVPLYDAAKQYIKSITGTNIDDTIIEFTISDSDFATAVYIGASYKTSGDKPMLILEETYPTDRTYQLPQYDFIDLRTVRYCGKCPSNINTITKAGYYSDVSKLFEGVPSDYNTSAGLLLVLPYALNSEHGIQILIDSTNSLNVWRSFYKMDGTTSSFVWEKSVNRWELNAAQNAIATNSIKLSQKDISLSGNYFDWKNADWQDGYDNGTEIVSASGFHYAFAPLQGPGSYIRVMRNGTFGTTCSYICLFDKDKSRIKVLTGTRIGETNGWAFELSEEDAVTAAYITMNYKEADGAGYSGLYYESEAYPLSAGIFTPLPNHKGKSNPIYKSVVVCDGDSICIGVQDKPDYRSGWWGRLVTDYSASGRNFAVGGGTITSGLRYQDDTARHCVSTDIDVIHTEYPELDYLILEGGTNDADLIGRFIGDNPPQGFGTWSETDFSGNYDHTTFCGAVEYMFNKALNYWPHAKIGFIIPMQMGTNNASSANRRRYFDTIKQIAKKWHVPVLDLWEDSQMDARLTVYYDSSLTSEQNLAAEKCYYDGQHPTSYGYNLMQGKIDAWVNSL